MDPNWEPAPGVTFEAAVQYRKRQGFNSVSMIAAFPTWASDQYANTYADRNGIYLRNAWEAFGVLVDGKTPTAKAMHDEQGYRSFEILPNRDGLADFDRVVPHYFQSLDRKMQYLSDQGFIPMIETIRRDVAPAWKAYFKFNESFSRFVQYIAARYGAYNFIFSKVHFDIYLKNYSITGAEFNEALNYHYKKYGPMPFGQPVTALIDHSTAVTFGHGDQAPWITMHATGNKPRDHGIYAAIEELFRLSPPYPAIDLEPYYTGWMHQNNVVAGERPTPDSDRDNYFSRAQMYGCVLIRRAGRPRARNRGVRRLCGYRACRRAAIFLAGPPLPIRGLYEIAREVRDVRGSQISRTGVDLRRPDPKKGGRKPGCGPRRLEFHDAHCV